MRALRTLALVIIGGLVTVGVIADQRTRSLDQPVPPLALATPEAASGTWFCVGGSGATGAAAVGLELINVGSDDAVVEILPVRDDQVVGDRVEVVAAAGGRTPVNLPGLAPEATWVGAIVEVDDPGVVVEQTFDGLSGTDRAPCATNTATALFSADGATRVLAEGEEMVLLLLNPFQEDAVADIRFDADVGPDRLEAVVVPARRVVAIDVTAEVTVASRVQTTVDVVSGRLVGHRLQIRNGTNLRGLAVTPMAQRGGVVTVVPSVRSDQSVFDRIVVTNPSADEVAEVDLDIVTDGSVVIDPVELTVRPGRSVTVDVASESRLAALGEFAVVARSLTGVPVAVGLERQVLLTADQVPGTAALPAVDAAATRWAAPLAGNVGRIQVVNPSATAIATVELLVVGPEGTESAQQFELGPGRWQAIDGAAFGARAVVIVDASAPVVVGRELTGFTSRQLLGGIVLEGPVALDQVD